MEERLEMQLKPKNIIDCLFVHTPKFKNYYKPFNEYMFVKNIPMGVIGIADLLNKRGYHCQIVHLGVEWIVDRKWSLNEYVRENQVKVVAMPLYWHYQSYDTIEVARDVKKASPSTYIVLGGFTASFFSKEIIDTYPFIDAIIKGDGEMPMLRLVEELQKVVPNLSKVPNLTWKHNGETIKNGISFLTSTKELDQLSYANFSLLKNYEVYVKVLGRTPSLYMKKVSQKWNIRKSSKPIIPIAVGKGCSQLCSWCAGNASAQMNMFGRKGVIFRSAESVIFDIIQAKKYGFERIYMELLQGNGDQDYFTQLFSKIQKSGIKIAINFEQSSLPSRAFIDEFAQTFPGPESTLCISRQSFDDEVRKSSKENSYTNELLMKTLRYIEKKEISVELAINFALPGEDETQLPELISFRKMLFKTFKCIKSVPIRTKDLEPGSLWHTNPGNFEIKISRKGFCDFYNYNKDPKTSSYSDLGYRLPKYFKGADKGNDLKTYENEIQKIKCNYFCMLGLNSGSFIDALFGRLKCNAMNLYWKLRNFDSLKH